MTNSQHNVARDFGDIAPLEPNDVIHVIEEFPHSEFENGEPPNTVLALPDYLVGFRHDDNKDREPLINIQKALGLKPNCMFRSGESQYCVYRLPNPEDRAKLEYIAPPGAVLLGISAEIPIPDNDTEDAYHLIVGNHDGIVAVESDDIEEAANQLGLAWPSLHFHLEAEETGGNSEDVPLNCERTAALVLFQRLGFEVEAIDTVTRKRYEFAGDILPLELFRRHPNQVPAARLPDEVIALVSENLANLTAYLDATQVEPLVTLRNGTKHAALFKKHPAEELTPNPVLPADVSLLRPGTLIQLPFGSNLQNCEIQVRGYDKLSEFPFEDLAYPPPEVMELIGSLAAQQKGSAVELSAEDTQERILRNEATQRQQSSQTAVDEVPQPTVTETANVNDITNVAEPEPTEKPAVANGDDAAVENPSVPEAPRIAVPEQPTLLDRFSLRGKSDEIRKQIVDEKPLLDRLALTGQLTMWYGPTNAGKTLIFMALLTKAISEGRIPGGNCYYFNADDSGSGLLIKNDLMNDLGCHIIAPGYASFEVSRFDDLLTQMAENGQAKGTFVVLDTAKKFVDPLNKKDSARFATMCRRFSLKGGTALVLAHTNKYPNANGKQQYAGAADLMQDFDAAFTIDVLSDTHDDKVIEFTKNKGRGDSVGSAAYAFNNHPSLTYPERLASVREVDPDQLNSLQKVVAQANDAEVIVAIKAAIHTGSMSKMELAVHVAGQVTIGRNKVVNILERYQGDNAAEHLWYFETGPNGRKTYRLHGPPPAD